MTVQEAIDALNEIPDKSVPFIITDSRSGAAEEISSIRPSEIREVDTQYAIDYPVGSPVARAHIG